MGNFKTERLNRLKNEASMNNQLENDQEYTPEEQALMDQATKPYQRYEVAVMADQRRAQEARGKSGQALVDGKMEQKRASLLAYYLQRALSNVGRVNFEDWEEEEKRKEEEEEVEEEEEEY